MRVLYNDVVSISGLDFSAESAEKPALFAQSDIVSLHVPLTDRTLKMIDRDALAAFKPSACLINTARGRIVDSPALAEALEKGRIAGAALDVLDVEPPPADHPLLTAPNCLLSPHVGSRTRASLAAMNDVVDDVIAVLEGRSPTHPATATHSEPERPKKH
jgi:phosphoglycerate dehydrogenase-like enzyme